MVCPYAKCNNCCIMHSNGIRADPELVGGGVGAACCCWILLRLALMLVLTFHLWHKHSTCVRCGFTHCTLCWWYFFIQPLAQILYVHTWWYHLCNLCWWCFFLPTTGADNVLTLQQLALCGGGLWWWLQLFAYVVVVSAAMSRRWLNEQWYPV